MIDSHICILGQTRKGKTYFAAKLFRDAKHYAIFINTQHEDYFKKSSPKWLITNDFDIRDLQKYKKLVINIELNKIESTLDQIATMVFAVGGDEKCRIWLSVFIDEAHLIATKSKMTYAYMRLITQGLKYGCRVISIAQRPSLLHHTVLTQSYYQFIFSISPYEFNYFSRNFLDIDAHLPHLEKKYHYLAIEGHQITEKPPI